MEIAGSLRDTHQVPGAGEDLGAHPDLFHENLHPHSVAGWEGRRGSRREQELPRFEDGRRDQRNHPGAAANQLRRGAIRPGQPHRFEETPERHTEQD